jgi:hypothetical protein
MMGMLEEFVGLAALRRGGILAVVGDGAGSGFGAAAQAEEEPGDEFGLQPGDPVFGHKEVLDPDLGSILDADHFSAEAEVGGEGAQAASEDQVGLESLPNLLGGLAVEGEGEDGVARQEGGDGLGGVG